MTYTKKLIEVSLALEAHASDLNPIAVITNRQGIVKQHDARTDNGLQNIMISTDPPCYDNIRKNIRDN